MTTCWVYVGDHRPRRSPNQFIEDEGFAWLTEDDFLNHFAGGVGPVRAKVLKLTEKGAEAALAAAFG